MFFERLVNGTQAKKNTWFFVVWLSKQRKRKKLKENKKKTSFESKLNILLKVLFFCCFGFVLWFSLSGSFMRYTLPWPGTFVLFARACAAAKPKHHLLSVSQSSKGAHFWHPTCTIATLYVFSLSSTLRLNGTDCTMEDAAEAFEQYLGHNADDHFLSDTCLSSSWLLHCPLQPRSEWEPDHVDMDIDSGRLGLSGQCFLS